MFARYSVMTPNTRSIALLTRLFRQLESLGDNEPVLHKIYLYMLCAMKYKISKVVIGQSPYPSSMVPTLGAFSRLTFDRCFIVVSTLVYEFDVTSPLNSPLNADDGQLV